MSAMKQKFLALVAVASLSVFAVGCYTTPEGRHHAGVPFAKDTIEGRYERPLPQVYTAAKKVLEDMGTLRGDNSVTKVLEARVDTRSIWVRLEETEANVTRVMVQVRTKNGGSDIYLAHEVEKRIALQLK